MDMGLSRLEAAVFIVILGEPGICTCRIVLCMGSPN